MSDPINEFALDEAFQVIGEAIAALPNADQLLWSYFDDLKAEFEERGLIHVDY